MESKRSLRHYSIRERTEKILRESGIPESEAQWLLTEQPPLEFADQWIENAIGYFSIPLGIAENFVIDGTPRRVPLAIEETSIIAALSSAAKWISEKGEITTGMTGSHAIGQIQFPRVRHPDRAREKLLERSQELISLANESVPGLVSRGGGFRRVEVRLLPRPEVPPSVMLVVHLLCDPCDAMGANLINQACEQVSGTISDWIDEPAGLRILSNLTDRQRVWSQISLRRLPDGVAEGIEEASRFAELDPYRAATHNKGIMNGIDGVLLATGNDWRAVEAGAHAYAATSGKYRPLSTWRRSGAGALVGHIDLPMSVGIVGGVTRSHPAAAICLKILGVSNARELARIVAAVGLTQNLAALRALTSTGIVAGHIRLHLTNLAMTSDATPEERDRLVRALGERLHEQRRISSRDAHELLETMRKA